MSLARIAPLLVLALCAAACSDSGVVRAEYLRSGDAYVADKRYADAIVQYRNAVEQDPAQGDARRKLAAALAASDNGAAALKEFVRAADLMPTSADAQIDAIKALMLAGQFEDAGTRAEAILKLDPNNVDAHILRGGAAAGMRDLEGAISSIDAALALAPARDATYLSLARLQTAKGQNAEAEASFKQALAVQPTSVPAHLALANYYWQSGRAAEAEQSIHRALAHAPAHAEANRMLSALYSATGRAAEAEAPLKMLAAGSDDLGLKIALADYYLAQKRPDAARPVLDALATHADAYAAAKARIAAIEYAAGRRQQAHTIVDAVLARQPKNAEVLVLKSRWLFADGKLDDARIQALAAVASDPRSVNGHSLLGDIAALRNDFAAATTAYNEVLRLNPRSAPAMMALARLNILQKRPEQAARFASDAVDQQPAGAMPRFTLAQALVATRDYDRALAALQPVADAAPGVAEVHVLLGRIQSGRGNAAAARQAYEQGLSLDPRSFEAVKGLITLEVRARQFDTAVRRAEAQIAAEPANAPLRLLAAQTYASAGNMPAVEESLRKAVAIDPQFFAAYRMLAQLYVRRGELAEATRQYQRLAARQPQDVSLHTMVAVLLEVQNKPAEARAVYEEIVGIDPRAPIAANNLAYMYAEQGVSLDAALRLAQIATAAAPDDADYSDTLGWVYFKRDMIPLAIDTLRRSVEQDPSSALPRYHLAVAYLKSGDKVRARTLLEEALRQKLDGVAAADARRLLASMEG